jgi:hypothetical protein
MSAFNIVDVDAGSDDVAPPIPPTHSFREVPGFAALVPEFESTAAFCTSIFAGNDFKLKFDTFQDTFVKGHVAAFEQYHNARKALDKIQILADQGTCPRQMRVLPPKGRWVIDIDDCDFQTDFEAEIADAVSTLNTAIGQALLKQQSRMVQVARERLEEWDKPLLTGIRDMLRNISPPLADFTVKSELTDDAGERVSISLAAALMDDIINPITARIRSAHVANELRFAEAREKERLRREKAAAAKTAANHLPVERAAVVVVEQEVAKQVKASGRDAELQSLRARITALETQARRSPPSPNQQRSPRNAKPQQRTPQDTQRTPQRTPRRTPREPSHDERRETPRNPRRRTPDFSRRRSEPSRMGRDLPARSNHAGKNDMAPPRGRFRDRDGTPSRSRTPGPRRSTRLAGQSAAQGKELSAPPNSHARKRADRSPRREPGTGRAPTSSGREGRENERRR